MQNDKMNLIPELPYKIVSKPPSNKAPVKRVRKGNKIQISFTISEALLNQVDRLAQKNGQSRAGLINLALSQLVTHGLTLEGEPSAKE